MDGFDYLTNLTPNIMDMRFMQLAAIENIRNSGMFHFSMYAAPEDLQSLPPQGSFITNLILPLNTIIYAVLAFEQSDDFLTPDVARFTFKVYLEPGSPIVEQYVRGPYGQDWTLRGLSLTSASNVCDRMGLPYSLLDEPVHVLDSRVRIEISNPSTTDTIKPMVALICAEPAPAVADLAGRNCA